MKMRIFMLAAVLTSSSIYAQEDSTKRLDEVVVTATKNQILQSLTGKVINVINAEELQRNSGKTITEVLNTQPGIIINGVANSPGTNQDVYLWGSAAGKSLILLDGVPVYDPSGISGAFDLNFIATDQVERIEILKGSHSTLYGSDAIAGVINIISKKASPKKISFTTNLAAGSYSTFAGSVGVNGTLNKTSYSINYNKTYSKGFSSAFDQQGNNNFEKDGLNRDVFGLNVQQKISPRLQLKLNAQYSKYKADTDSGPYTDDIDYVLESDNLLAGIGASYKIGKNMLHFNYSYNETSREYFDDSIPPVGFAYFSEGKYVGKTHLAELYGNFPLHKNIDLLVGADFRRQLTEQDYFSVSMFGPFKSPSLDDTARVDQLGAYASVNLKDLSGFNVEIGGRYNNFNKYGNVFTFSFNPSYLINKKFKIFANVATGFKAPSLYQVYSEYRNPVGLDPEKSFSLEGGVQYFKENVNIRAVYFIRNIKDNIVFFSGGAPDFLSYYVNANEQKDKGFEVDAKVKVRIVHLSAGYTNLDGRIEARENDKDTSYFNLYRRPKQTINLNAGIDLLKNWNMNIGVQSVSKRKEGVFGGPPVNMPAYFTWNVYSSYMVTKSLKIYGDFKNITDEQYVEVLGYNSRRFNFMAGLQVTL